MAATINPAAAIGRAVRIVADRITRKGRQAFLAFQIVVGGQETSIESFALRANSRVSKACSASILLRHAAS
jgi:hypothetical protein